MILKFVIKERLVWVFAVFNEVGIDGDAETVEPISIVKIFDEGHLRLVSDREWNAIPLNEARSLLTECIKTHSNKGCATGLVSERLRVLQYLTTVQVRSHTQRYDRRVDHFFFLAIPPLE